MADERDPGAIGRSGTKEKDITLIISKKVASLLSGKIDVYLTRWVDKVFGSSDVADLQARCDIANRIKADLFVSIHCNSSENVNARGMEIYTLIGQGKADVFAEIVVNKWTELIPNVLIRKDMSDGDSDKEADFYVLRNTIMPAVLIELAFISNPEEEQLLNNSEFQDKCAQVVAESVLEYFGIVGNGMAEDWKQKIMEAGQSKLNIEKSHKPDEVAEKWFVVALTLRAIDLAVKEIKEELIRLLKGDGKNA